MIFQGVQIFDGTSIRTGRYDVTVGGGTVVSVTESARSDGGALAPGFVDAHVHLSFFSPPAVLAGGVTGVLDLGAPLVYSVSSPLRYRFAGPLLTSPGGYPTRSWGANGYGLGVSSAEQTREAVAFLAARGAAIIKVALPDLGFACTLAAVEEASSHGLEVAAHALLTDAVGMALDAGVTVLAHTPLEIPSRLDRITVISTVRAFGADLGAALEAGASIAYGTDLGNDGISPGLDAKELSIIAGVLGSDEAALRTATMESARVAGLPQPKIVPGATADLVHADSLSFEDLARPRAVYVGGVNVA